MTSLEETLDNLNADFTAQSRREMQLRDELRTLEKEESATAPAQRKSKATQLNEKRSQLSTLQLQKAKTQDSIDDVTQQLLVKTGQLNTTTARVTSHQAPAAASKATKKKK